MSGGCCSASSSLGGTGRSPAPPQMRAALLPAEPPAPSQSSLQQGRAVGMFLGLGWGWWPPNPSLRLMGMEHHPGASVSVHGHHPVQPSVLHFPALGHKTWPEPWARFGGVCDQHQGQLKARQGCGISSIMGEGPNSPDATSGSGYLVTRSWGRPALGTSLGICHRSSPSLKPKH